MSNKKVAILGVPLGFGAGQTGSELGVNAMRLTKFRGAHLVEHIRSLGYNVTDRGDVEIVRPEAGSNGENPKHLTEMLASSENIFTALKNVLDNNEMPIILGGDHAIAIPTFSAIATHYKQQGTEIGLIWFDAHADINTPETSPSGNIHGMPLGSDPRPRQSRPRQAGRLVAKARPANTSPMSGPATSIPANVRRSKKLGLRDNFFTMSDIDKRGMAAVVEDAVAIASQAPAVTP